MKQLKEIIIEKLKIDKDSKSNKPVYTCHPKDWDELRSILKERLKEDKNADLNDIDVSNIKDLGSNHGYGLFEGLDPHDIKIDKWDVSHVEIMTHLFDRCENFEGKGLENWNVSNVENMQGMFNLCEIFNGDLSKWKTPKVTNMINMFYGCIKFTGKGLENWDVSNVRYMKYMFDRCKSLKNKPSWYHE